jgi:nicotinamidase-related amidase
MKPVLLVIDMQKYFQNEYPKIFQKKITPNVQNVINTSRLNNVDIVFVITKYMDDKSNWPEAFKDRSKIWCLENNEETNFIDGINPTSSDSIICKNRFTGFYHTNLNELLTTKGIDTLFICGFAADVCIRYTTMDAYNEGYSLYWLTECMDSGFEKITKSIAHMQRLTRVKTVTNSEYSKFVGKEKKEV